MKKKNIIRLNNAIFYGYHGNEHGEEALGGKYHIDVEIETDFRAATETDNLDDTINYESVYRHVHHLVTEHRFYLIETLAQRIVKVLLDKFPRIQSIAVRVRKPGAPIHGVVDNVEVEIVEDR
ncbi:MAG: dihydroneopterin aldolase [Chlorobi bacterium]|nr:dihydroneopterin aldolase [Chlorobiota bacterium]